jgi:L-phenylalanine/L-methionine N-acetyltransferase
MIHPRARRAPENAFVQERESSLSLEPLHSSRPTARTSGPAASPTGIRRYEHRDLEAVFQIFDQPQCRRFLGRDPFTTEAEVKAWFDVLAERTIKLVAIRADIPVGIGVLVRDAGSRAHVGALSLFVHDRFQRLGIGSSLLQFLMASSRVYRLQRLELSVVCDNEAALRLYLKSGFRIEGRLIGAFRYGGRFHDAYVMSLLGNELAARPPGLEPRRSGAGSGFSRQAQPS